MQKILQVVCVVLIAAAVMFGGRWYMYVARAESPYDEVGIALNGYMPGPLRTWGCHKLQQRFPGQLAPYGCAGADGRSWRSWRGESLLRPMVPDGFPHQTPFSWGISQFSG